MQPRVSGSGAARRVAAILRADIVSGRLAPGAPFPSERDLQQRYEISRDTATRIVSDLRHQGLIVVRHGQPTTVRPHRDKQPIIPPPGSTVEARMPTPEERDEFDSAGDPVHDGIPVFVITAPDGQVSDPYPADRFVIRSA